MDKERIKELLKLLIHAGGLKERISLVAALAELLRPMLESDQDD